MYNVLNQGPMSSYLRSRINAELELSLLAIVDRQPLHKQGGKA